MVEPIYERESGIIGLSVSIDGRETYDSHAITAGSGTECHVDDHQQVEGIGDELAHDGPLLSLKGLDEVEDEEEVKGV
jgi:hypothetical protein